MEHHDAVGLGQRIRQVGVGVFGLPPALPGFDSEEFLSPHGLRSLSRRHLEAPYDAGLGLPPVAYEPGESLAEAEDEIGISGWIDPDTGQPAEESIPRTEDH